MGLVAGQVRWWPTEIAVIHQLAGIFQFYVEGVDWLGRVWAANCQVESTPHGWEYLRTVPDYTGVDNLLSLPPVRPDELKIPPGDFTWAAANGLEHPPAPFSL